MMLFPTHLIGRRLDAQQERQYDVAPDGQFLINMETGERRRADHAVDELDARGEEVASQRIIPLWSRYGENPPTLWPETRSRFGLLS